MKSCIPASLLSGVLSRVYWSTRSSKLLLRLWAYYSCQAYTGRWHGMPPQTSLWVARPQGFLHEGSRDWAAAGRPRWCSWQGPSCVQPKLDRGMKQLPKLVFNTSLDCVYLSEPCLLSSPLGLVLYLNPSMGTAATFVCPWIMWEPS